MVTFHEATDGSGSPSQDAAVVTGARREGDARPLCEPAPMRVEFWTLTATTTGTEMSSVLRYGLSVDGRRTRTVGFPAGLLATWDGAAPSSGTR